jgi:hypothetical protein
MRIDEIKPGEKLIYNYQYPPKPEIVTVKAKPYIWYDKKGTHIEIPVEEKDFNIDISFLSEMKGGNT